MIGVWEDDAMTDIVTHLVQDYLEAREHSIDRLSRQLNKVLILPSVSIEESGLNMGRTLLKQLKCAPDLLSDREMSNPLKLSKT